MDIKLNQNDRVRVNGSLFESNNNFIDLSTCGMGVLSATLFPFFQYIEIRRKGDLIKVFTMPKKSYKKECDFKGWEDAEVIFSINEQKAHK